MTARAMVVTPQPEATEAGVAVLRAGGNAVDAAIACGLVQGVVDPLMCGIAGFGSAAIRLPGVMGRASGRDRITYTPAAKALYCRPDGSPKQLGDVVRNRDYATVLRLIARDGAGAMKGEIADAIEADMKASGGLLRRADGPVVARLLGCREDGLQPTVILQPETRKFSNHEPDSLEGLAPLG